MNDQEFIEWLRLNSSGVYRPSALAADRLEELIKGIKEHRDTFPDGPLDGEEKLWKLVEDR